MTALEPHDHMRQARLLLGMVNHPLIAANPQLLSEILWGAATQMVKATAKSHNLPSGNHRELFRAVREFARRTADTELLPEFGAIEKLHINFYDGEMSNAEIEQNRVATMQFVAKMQNILDAP